MSAYDTDEFVRELEERLARTAADAVPEAGPVPAPPWRERPRRVDPRRFGRATPWLVAAVLLVVAGLGTGATVAFDADAPNRAPVGTSGPSPSAVDSSQPDPTASTAAPSDGPTSAAPVVPAPASSSLDRGVAASAPPESDRTPTPPDPSSWKLGVGTYGPLRVGMTQAEVVQALGGWGSFTPVGSGGACGQLEGPSSVFTVLTKPGRGVVGFVAPTATTDALGTGPGATLAQIRSRFPMGTLVEDQTGWNWQLVDGDAGLSYAFAGTATGDAPTDTATVQRLVAGSPQFSVGSDTCQ